MTKTDSDNDNYVMITTTNDHLIYCDRDIVNLAQDYFSWAIDSGASCHVTSRRDFFSSYTSGDFGDIKMGDSDVSKVVGVGDVCLKFDSGMELNLQYVKHVLDMRMNFISTGLLDDEGYVSNFGNGQWKLAHDSLIVARGKRCPKLYMTQLQIIKGIVNAVENVDMINLWHNRLAHMTEKGMNMMSKKKLLSSLTYIHLKRCSHCVIGKKNMVSFKSHHPSRKEHILDLVHSNVCGPMKTKTNGCSLYFVTFIDYHSRKLWVYTLNNKDQVPNVFNLFRALLERQIWKKLKCIRTDNGGEYIGPFDVYCRQQGIRHQRTPQLNSLAERMNITLVEWMRCLILHTNLLMYFWGEALNTAVNT